MAKRNKKRNKKQRKSRRQVNESRTSNSISPAWMGIVGFVLGLPRLIRIIIAGIFSLTITLTIGLAFYLVDIRFLISINGEVTTRMTISVVVATVVGLIAYVIGWFYIVGMRGEEIRARNGILWYLVVGIISVILSIIWGIQVMLVV